MTIQYRLNGALLPGSTVRYNPEADASFPSAAFYCDPMVAGVIIEDSSGTLDLTGWTPFTVDDDACSKPRIFTGWIAGKEISRGRDSNRVGAARVWNCDIVDQNAAASFEVLRSTAASVRPQETDVARVQAVIVSHAMAGTPVADNGRLSTDDPRTLSATNFVTQYPAEVLMSSAGQCAKNVYFYWDESAQEISIHYDAVGTGPAATISFSNVAADVNSTTVFAPLRDATLVQDPYNLYTGVLLGWVGGFTYGRNQSLIDELSPNQFSPSEFLRDQVVRSDRIGKAATAATYLQTQLDIYGIERETLTFSAILPASVVNLAHAGDVVTVKFSHLPGYTTNTDVVIVRRSVRPLDDHDSLYEVTFECANFATERGPGGGSNGPHQTGSAGPVQFKYDHADGSFASITFDTPPTEGNTLVLMGMSHDSTINTPSGFTVIEGRVRYPDVFDTDGAQMFYRVVQAGDPSTYALTGSGVASSDNHILVAEFEGIGALLDSDSVDMGSGPSPDVPFSVGSVTVATRALLVSIGGYGDGNPSPGETFSPVDSTELFDTHSSAPWWAGGWRTVAAGTYNETYMYSGAGAEDGRAGIVAAFEIEGGIPPLPGQPVPPATPTGDVDGSNTDYETEFPFAEGSLRVLHDGIDQTSHITDSDADAGTFTLDYAPSAGSTLEVYYQGHP